MANNDLNSSNIPFNPINPGTQESQGVTKNTSMLNTVSKAFKEMKETATEGVQQLKDIFVKENKTDSKTSSAVANFFSKSIPQFGKDAFKKISNLSLKNKISNLFKGASFEEQFRAQESIQFHGLSADEQKKLRSGSMTDAIIRTAEPLSRRMSELKEKTSPALAVLSEKIDSLKSIIPSLSPTSTHEIGDDISIHVEMESIAPRRDIHSDMPMFLNEVADLKAVRFGHAYTERMQTANEELNKELGITEDKGRPVTYDVGRPPENAWKMKKVDAKKTYKLNGVQVRGSTLNALKEKTRVTYDNNVVDPETLAGIMKNGAQNHQEQIKASGRCIVSTDILTQDNNGEARQVDKDNPNTFQTYTINAPNLSYNPEIIKMMTVDGKISMGLWQKEMTRLLVHVLKEAKKDNLEMLVIPAIGMGAFMPDAPKELKAEAKQAFLNALMEARKAAGAEELEIVVTGKEMEGVSSSDEHVHIVGSKDAFGVLGIAIDKNFRVGLINAGDPSGQTGQYANYKKPPHIALEEGLAINAPTLRINQNPSSNKAVGDASKYIAS